jgi:hypothetical protein
MMKHILVSITCRGRLHWRLISATREGRHWKISEASYKQFLSDIGQNGIHRITLG